METNRPTSGSASPPSPRVIAAMLLDRRDLPEPLRRAIGRVIAWRKIPPADAAVILRVARELAASRAG